MAVGVDEDGVAPHGGGWRICCAGGRVRACVFGGAGEDLEDVAVEVEGVFLACKLMYGWLGKRGGYLRRRRCC